MELKFDVVKPQKFEIGRTINPFLCDCDRCNYLNCQKNNYCVKTKVHKYKTKDFLEEYGNELKNQKHFSKELLDEYISNCFHFPKGLYFSVENSASHKGCYYIELCSFNRRGIQILKCRIYSDDGKVEDYDCSQSQYMFALRIADGIREVNKFISQ